MVIIKRIKEHCDSRNNAFDFRLEKPIRISGAKPLRKFEDVINLFKQEIEIRRDFKVLDNIFIDIAKKLNSDFHLEITKLEGKQFYTDVEKFIAGLYQIFEEIKKRKEFKDIMVTTKEPEDTDIIELYIIQKGSQALKSKDDLFKKIEKGNFATIKSNFTNLCDWSIESSYNNKGFRINFLKSNNVKDIEELDYVPDGFTHILKFYKR